MRILAPLALAAVFGAGFAVSAFAVETPFARGVQLYEKGQYKSAAQEFEKFLDAETVSAAGLYNLGNCYFKLGQKGKAVWAYEKALLLNPRDEDLRWNLELLRKQLPDRQDAPPSGLGLHAWVTKKTSRLRTDEIAWAFSGIVGVFTILVLAAAAAPGARPFVWRILFAVVLAAGAAGAVAWARWDDIRYPAAVVTDREVYVRYGPSKDATRAFLLHEGSKVDILKESAGWFSVRFGGKDKGWIERETVRRIR